MNAPERPRLRLTEFSHGGGCGCKIAPGVLRDILAGSAAATLPKALLVGIETSDDAAVYALNDTQAIVATTDFFMPIVDDPEDFGRIAATNALSDVYAMGATPLFALALVAMPVNALPIETIRLDHRRRRSRVPRRRHSDRRRTYDRLGRADLRPGGDRRRRPRHLKRNAGARPGDVLVLGKPLGVGIYSAALKKEKLDAAGYAALRATHDEAQHARHRVRP